MSDKVHELEKRNMYSARRPGFNSITCIFMKEAKWTSLYFARVARFPGNSNLKFILRTWTGWLLSRRKLPSGKRVRKGEETTKLKNTVYSFAPLYARMRFVSSRFPFVGI